MRDDQARLLDILDAIDRISRYTNRGRAEFDADELIQNWVIHHLEMIGEACGRLAVDVRDANPSIPWRGYIGMRNILAHQYFGIDLEPVWLAATAELPILKTAVEGILKGLGDSG